MSLNGPKKRKYNLDYEEGASEFLNKKQKKDDLTTTTTNQEWVNPFAYLLGFIEPFKRVAYNYFFTEKNKKHENINEETEDDSDDSINRANFDSFENQDVVIPFIYNLNDFCITKKDFLARFPLEHFYRFAIDGHRQSKGWTAFEVREPGYLQGVLNAYFYAYNYSGAITKKYLEEIQAHALDQVEYTNVRAPYYLGFTPDGSLRPSFCVLHLSSNMSLKGAEEKIFLEGSKECLPQLIGGCIHPTKEVEEALNAYKLSIFEANTLEKKLQAIILMITKLERIHPFRDANCRTFCMVLLQTEILNLGLLPPIMDDPNRFDGFSQSELFEQVVKGMRRTKELIEHGKISTPFEIITERMDFKGKKTYFLKLSEESIEINERFEENKFFHTLIFLQSINKNRVLFNSNIHKIKGFAESELLGMLIDAKNNPDIGIKKLLLTIQKCRKLKINYFDEMLFEALQLDDGQKNKFYEIKDSQDFRDSDAIFKDFKGLILPNILEGKYLSGINESEVDVYKKHMKPKT